jgi:glycosyltransferase involved in cell wall biosynthesis
MKMPVIAATDSNTDIGNVIEDNKCGYKVISGDVNGMLRAIENILCSETNFNQMKENAWRLMEKEYNVERSYNLIKVKVNV